MGQYQDGDCIHPRDSVCRQCIYKFLNWSLGEEQAQRILQTFLAWLRSSGNLGNTLGQYVNQVPQFEYFFILLVCTHFDPVKCREWGIDIEL